MRARKLFSTFLILSMMGCVENQTIIKSEFTHILSQSSTCMSLLTNVINDLNRKNNYAIKLITVGVFVLAWCMLWTRFSMQTAGEKTRVSGKWANFDYMSKAFLELVHVLYDRCMLLVKADFLKHSNFSFSILFLTRYSHAGPAGQDSHLVVIYCGSENGL